MPRTQQETLIAAIGGGLDAIGVSKRVSDAVKDELNNYSTRSGAFGDGSINPEFKVPTSKEINSVIGFELFNDFGAVGVLLTVFSLLFQGMNFMQAAITPAREKALQHWSLQIAYRDLSPSEALSAMQRSLINPSQMKTILGKTGLHDNYINMWVELHKPRLSVDELAQASFRGNITNDNAIKEMFNKGFTIDEAQAQIDIRKFAIQPQDLIRLAVKEAYSPEAIAKFNLDEAFPTNVVADAAKVGMSEEQLKLFWRGHWNLPSPSQGFEMFQRLRNPLDPNHFSKDDLNQLLKFLDFPEPFRDKLEAISRPRMPRVDIRRAYALGGRDISWVQEKYRDLGYDDDNVQALTEIAINQGSNTEKELSRSAIQNLYEEGEISRQAAVNLIDDIGYSNSTAEFYITLTDFDVANKELKDELNNIQQLFIDFVINEQQLEGKLGQLNLSSDRKDTLLRKWKRQRQNKIKLPSRTDLEKWYEHDIISGDNFEQAIIQNGYNRNFAINYRHSIEINLADKTKKESERAARELERTRKDEFASIERLERARLQSEVAELNVNIAEIKVALHEVLTEDVVADLKLLIDEQKLLKTIIQVDIARLPLTMSGDVRNEQS